MTLIKLPNDHFAVQVKQDWSDFEFNESDINVLMFCTPERIEHIVLPSGSYTIVSLASEITEGQAGEIVPEGNRMFGGKRFNYIKKANVCSTALDSFRSLLSSLSLEPSQNLIIKQNK